MSILPIAQRGEAILTLVAAPVTEVEFGSMWLKAFTHTMQAAMLERNEVGIAAPQVYLSKRIIIVASRTNPRYPDAPDISGPPPARNTTSAGREWRRSPPNTPTAVRG